MTAENKAWGQKRRCAACGAAFYDLERTPISCPKCGVEYESAVLLRSDGRTRKKRGQPAEPAPPATVAKPAADADEAADSEVEHVLEPEDDDEAADAPDEEAGDIDEEEKAKE